MALKVFDLQCEHGHVFEGWFASRQDYDSQQERGLVSCPMCASAKVSKRLSAPHLNVAHLRAPAQPATAKADDEAARVARMQKALLEQVRKRVRQSENVGPRFAEEARLMHEGVVAERPIRGTATPQERVALAEEGIDVLALPAFLDDEQMQ